MIRKAIKTDSINLVALSIQVWLHTYASEGIRKEISFFVLKTFTEEYFNTLLNDPNYRILVFIKENHLVGYILGTWAHNEKAINFYKHFGFIDIGHTYFELNKDELHENRILAYRTT